MISGVVLQTRFSIILWRNLLDNPLQQVVPNIVLHVIRQGLFTLVSSRCSSHEVGQDYDHNQQSNRLKAIRT